LCKNILLAILFGSNGNLYTISTESDVCVCVYIFMYIHMHKHTHTHTYSSHYRDAGRAQGIKKIGTSVNAMCQQFTKPELRCELF